MILSNFVVLEGGDGSGTSTQLASLKRLTENRTDLPPFYFTYEPTDGPIGALIRQALGTELSLQAETLARLFAADRGEHLKAKGGIIERCKRGEIVISDRYILSSLVYQGLDCGDELPESLNAAFPLPQLLIFFNVESSIAVGRFSNRALKDRYETSTFQDRVYQRYEELLPHCEKKGIIVRRVNAAASIEHVTEEVWRAVTELPILNK